MGRFHKTHPYVGERGNKFGEIYNLILVEARHNICLDFDSNLFDEKKWLKTRITRAITTSQLPNVKVNFEDFEICPKPQ